MTEENLGAVLDDQDGYLQYKRQKAIEKLSERVHLSLEQLAKLVDHPEHGAAIKDITLQELLAAQLDNGEDEAVEATESVVTSTPQGRKIGKKRGKKAAAKKTNGTTAKKAGKKKTAAAKKTNGNGRKADFGRKKPRLQRDQGYKEILAALKAHGAPMGRSDLEEATGYTGVQVRTFCKELAAQGKVEVLGKGGRSTQYGLA